MGFGILRKKKKEKEDEVMEASVTFGGKSNITPGSRLRPTGSSDGSLPGGKRRSAALHTPPLDPSGSAMSLNNTSLPPSTSFAGKYALNNSNKGKFYNYVPEEWRKEVGDTFESFMGWSVQVRDLPVTSLESMMKQTPSLVWDKKYWRGLGRKAMVVEDEEADMTLLLLFENPSATAWFPVAALDFLAPPKGLTHSKRSSGSSGGPPKVASSEGELLTPPLPTHKKQPTTETLFGNGKALKPGDIVVLKSNLEGPFGVVMGVDDDEDEPILVEWRDRKTEKKIETDVHKDTDLRKLDRNVERRSHLIRGGSVDSDGFDANPAANEFATKTELIYKFFDTDQDGYWSLEELNEYLTEADGIPLNRVQFHETCRELGANPSKGLLLADARTLLSNAETDLDSVHKYVRREMRQRKALSDNAIAEQDVPTFAPLFGVETTSIGGSSRHSSLHISPNQPPSRPPRSHRSSPSRLPSENPRQDFWSSPQRWKPASPISV